MTRMMNVELTMMAILGFFLLELPSQCQTRHQTEFVASSQAPQCDLSTENSTFLSNGPTGLGGLAR